MMVKRLVGVYELAPSSPAKSGRTTQAKEISPVSTLQPPGNGLEDTPVDLAEQEEMQQVGAVDSGMGDPMAMVAALAAAMAGKEDAARVTAAEETKMVGCIDPMKGGFTGEVPPQVAIVYLKMMQTSCPLNGQSPGSILVEAAHMAVRDAGFRPDEDAKQRAATKRVLALDTEGLLGLAQDLLGTKESWPAALFSDLQRGMTAIVSSIKVPGGECVLGAFADVDAVLRGPGGLPSQDIDWDRVGSKVLPLQLKYVCNEVRRSLRRGEIRKRGVGAGVLCPEASAQMHTVLLLGGPTGKALEELAGLKRKAEEAGLQLGQQQHGVGLQLGQQQQQQQQQRGMGLGAQPLETWTQQKCYSCGGEGHKAWNCPNPSQMGGSGKGKGGKGGAGKGGGNGGGNLRDVEVCLEFQKGECPEGAACPKTHIGAVCHAFKDGKRCRFGADCKFRHFME
jgi:hypothetical protein